MPAPDQIRQGSSYYFIAESCPEFDNAEIKFYVKRFPDDEPVIEKTGTSKDGQIEFVLTPEESASLDVGLWYLIRTTTLPNWYVEARKRVQIVKAWA